MKHYYEINQVPQDFSNRIHKEIEMSFKRSMTEESEKTLNESMIEFERRLLGHVEQGDIEGLLTFFSDQQIPFRVGYDVHDDLLQVRFIVVSTLTILARAAIRSGFSENEAFMLSDTYIQKSAELKNREEILWLISIAVLDFTKKIKEIKSSPKYSSVITFCCNYILEHIHTNITLEMLAKECNFSIEHLSRLFKKETGYTIKKYCILKKLEMSAYLLVDSKMSIQDISLYLGFSSHGRFSGYFKDLYGKTPKEYQRFNRI